MSKRNADTLIRRVREELRAEGPDGAGYSDFIIREAINAALDDLSEIFTIRDILEFTTTEDLNTYDLTDVVDAEIYNLLRVVYDGNITEASSMDRYLKTTLTEDGPVRHWLLWGNKLILIGKVEEDKTVSLWVTRAPKPLTMKDDTPETPRYADEAIVAFAVSVCYRESKDYERANYHYRIYSHQKGDLLKRAVPQGQRGVQPEMSDPYWGPFRPRR